MTTATITNEFKVGDGATMALWTEAHAGTIVKVATTKAGRVTEVVWQRDRARRTNRQDDTFEAGGFCGHTDCPKGQEWEYERDPNGTTYTFTPRATGKWVMKGHADKHGAARIRPGRHEKYDYNF